MNNAFWLDTNLFGILSDRGLFIYDSTKSVIDAVYTITFKESYRVSNVVFDKDSYHIFILDVEGEVRMTKIQEGALDSEFLETAFKGCITIFQGDYFMSEMI